MLKCRTAVSGTSSALCSDWRGHRPAALQPLCRKMFHAFHFSARLDLSKLRHFIRSGGWAKTFWPSVSGSGRRWQKEKLFSKLVWKQWSVQVHDLHPPHLAPPGSNWTFTRQKICCCCCVVQLYKWFQLIGHVVFSSVWTIQNQKVRIWNEVSVRKGPKFVFFSNSEVLRAYYQLSVTVLSVRNVCPSSAAPVHKQLPLVGDHSYSQWLALSATTSKLSSKLDKRCDLTSLLEKGYKQRVKCVVSVDPVSFASIMFYCATENEWHVVGSLCWSWWH